MHGTFLNNSGIFSLTADTAARCCLASSNGLYNWYAHYTDVITSAMASQIPDVSIVCSIGFSGADQGKHQSSASLLFVRKIPRSPMDSPHKGSVTPKMFPFDDVIMLITILEWHYMGMQEYGVKLLAIDRITFEDTLYLLYFIVRIWCLYRYFHWHNTDSTLILPVSDYIYSFISPFHIVAN